MPPASQHSASLNELTLWSNAPSKSAPAPLNVLTLHNPWESDSPLALVAQSLWLQFSRWEIRASRVGAGLYLPVYTNKQTGHMAAGGILPPCFFLCKLLIRSWKHCCHPYAHHTMLPATVRGQIFFINPKCWFKLHLSCTMNKTRNFSSLYIIIWVLVLYWG